MKKVFLKFIACAVIMCISGSVFAFDIAKHGKTDCVVVVPKSANAAERYAAEEFVKYIEQSSEVKLEITDTPQKFNNIYINTRKDVKTTWDSINFVVKNRSLYLTGDTDRGTIYSVYEFLEKYVGVKYFNDDRIVVPQKKVISCPNNLSYRFKPSFMIRDTSDVSCTGKPFGIMTKLNSNHCNSNLKYGGRMAIPGCHTLQLFLPVDKYGIEHPEYYALKGGSRYVMAESQPCFSNPEMRKELAKNVIDKLDKSSEKAIIDVSQNDNRVICECENCQAAIKKYGAYSGLLLECINYIADEVKKKYPDTLVETLAYHDTRKAPVGIVPRDNVLIRLCSIECNFAEPIGLKDKYAPYKRINCSDFGQEDVNSANKNFDKDLSDWSKITDKIFIWDYIVNFHNCFMPHPNFQVLKPNLEYFHKHNVLGVYGESNRDDYNASFDELRNYVDCKLMWDLSLDTKELIKEFCDGVYGEGSDDIQKCIDIFTDIFVRDHYYCSTYVEDMEWMSDDEIIESIKLYRSALEKTKDDAYAYDRIMTLYVSFLAGWYTLSDERFNKIKEVCELPWNTKPEFFKYLREYNDNPVQRNYYYKEHVPFDITKKAKVFVKTGPVPELCKGLKDEDWYTLNNVDINPSPKWGAIIKNDPSSTDGKIVALKNNGDWGAHQDISGNIGKDMAAGYKGYKIYALIKAEGKKSDEGEGMRIGFYDYDKKTRVFREAVPLSKIGEEYSYVYFGDMIFEDPNDIHIYFVGIKNDNYEYIDVDKILLIKIP